MNFDSNWSLLRLLTDIQQSAPASVCNRCSVQRYKARQTGLFLSQRHESAEKSLVNYVSFAIEYLPFKSRDASVRFFLHILMLIYRGRLNK
jgi:hypothetical protein